MARSMPPLIVAALVAAAPALGTTGIAIGGTFISAASVLGTAIFSGITFGLQQLLNTSPKGSQQRSQVTAKDANPRRIRGYGRMKLGGPTFFLEAINGAYLYTGIIHGEGLFDAYEEWWLDDVQAGIPGPYGGTNTTAPWTNHVHVYSYPGSDDQGASLELLGNFPGLWTEEHRLAGLAYSVMVCVLPAKAYKNFQKVFPNGAPSLRVVARLSRVYDPRNETADWNDETTYVWTRNASLNILDFLTYQRVDAVNNRVWQFLPKSRINIQSFIDFATLCDEIVPNVDPDVLATERYALDGIYDLSEEPRDVLRRMLATCDAELVPFPDGTVGIKGGKWEEPTVTLTDADITSFRYEQGNDKLSAFNRLKWTFTDPLNDFQQVDGDPWDDEEAQIEAGEILNGNLDLPMVQSHAQGRRLAKIYTGKMNPRHKLNNVVCKKRALDLARERVVRVVLMVDGEPFLNEVFFITRFAPAGDLWGATLDLSSIDPSAYEWDAATEEGQRPPVSTSTGTITPPPEPSGVVLSIVSAEVQPGFYATAIRASADPVADEFAIYWDLRGQYRLPGVGAEWIPMVSDNGSVTAVVSQGALIVGETYEVQVAYGGLNQQSSWVSAGTIEVTV
jgi:hypothetical protein